ncbi:MAG: hypothetical protein WCD57_20825 [Acidobacteriaceae bacterium]
MAMWLHELRERLLRAGVAPRHVRRYLTELREHWADLTAEEERAGRNPAEAATLALTRLGRVDELARTMIEQPELRSWTAQAPWAVLGAGPVLGLVAGWGIALLILWSGWTWFVQGSRTPFVPVHGFAIAYFGVGRMLYYSAPLLSGWGMIVLAGRQRMQTVWPVILGSLAVALLGATGAVDVQPPRVPGDTGRVGIQFFPASWQLPYAAGHALLLFVLVALPYLVWRWRSSRPDFESQ